MRLRLILCSLAIFACNKGVPTDTEDTNKDTDPTTDTDDTDTDTDSDTDSDTDTTPTSTYDCTTLPPAPTVWQRLNNIPVSEDFTIDADGFLWGVDTNTRALVKTTHGGNTDVVLPNVSSWGRGTRFLSTGDLMIAEPNSGSLMRVDLSGPSIAPVLGGLQEPNGVVIGDDDFVYLTEMTGKVSRVDPDTGDRTVIYDTPVSTDGITFAPDYRTLYWNSEQGQVVKTVLDADGAVVDPPAVLTTINGLGFMDLLDGMTTDACGNIYVVRMMGHIIRITPDGQQQEIIDLSGLGGVFISAVNFGSGAGGFERDNLYIMNLSGGVFEVEMGIEGKWEPHL